MMFVLWDGWGSAVGVVKIKLIFYKIQVIF